MLAALAAASTQLFSATAAEIDPVKIALLVDGMANRGSSYDAGELYALGPEGLAAVLDHLLPDTAPPPPAPSGPPEAEVRRLLAQLDAEDFTAREAATAELIATARGRRSLVEQAASSDSLEVRLRVERVLASWESRPAARLSAYLSGFWKYVEGLTDQASLELLAKRTVVALAPGMPEGDRLHLMRLCIAGVAHGRDHATCDLLRPLIRQPEVRVAALVTETVGAYKTEPHFLPQLLVDALASEHDAVVEAALRFVLDCQDDGRRPAVYAALRKVFASRSEPLKFQACLPLIRDFHDADAWVYVIRQTVSPDGNRVRTALNWIGDTKHSGHALSAAALRSLESLLSAKEPLVRRATATALGAYAGEPAVRALAGLLADDDESVVKAAESALLSQPDRPLVARILREEAAGANTLVRTRASELLSKAQ